MNFQLYRVTAVLVKAVIEKEKDPVNRVSESCEKTLMKQGKFSLNSAESVLKLYSPPVN